MAEAIQPRPSMLTRIFRELIAKSRRDGIIHRAGLAGGAQLAVLVRNGRITATVKRMGVPVGTTELATFRRHGSVPDDALVLTPPEQGTRIVQHAVESESDGMTIRTETWRYVTLRWEDTE